MPQRVLIAPDKFKGTLTALEAARAIAAGWSAIRPHDSIVLLPMSDGGDGFGSVLADSLQAHRHETATVDSAHRPRTAPWWLGHDGRTAVVETAQIIGLALLPQARFHPFDLDTFGIGTVLQKIVATGASECIAGIGGSSTNDGGFGLARALGWTFLDAQQEPITRWTCLNRLERMEPPKESLATVCQFTVAVDVDNPLLGPNGCSRIYGPQKGLRSEDMQTAEAALERLAEVANRCLGRDFASVPGSGAAGGLGFAFQAFLGARAQSGFDIFARASDLDRQITESDVVITGEGALDQQSWMGKGTGRMAVRAKSLGRHCIGLAGFTAGMSDSERESSPFNKTYAIVPGMTSEAEAKTHAAFWLEKLAVQAAQDHVAN
jgi:glycerate kinase